MTELASTIGLAALASETSLPGEPTFTSIAAAELDLRRQLSGLFPQGKLPCDPALDILLEIYVGMRRMRVRTPGDIAANTGLPTSSMTRWIKILEASGLVRRNKDKSDNRRVCLTLTDRGHALVERAIETIVSARAKPCQATPLQQTLFFTQ